MSSAPVKIGDMRYCLLRMIDDVIRDRSSGEKGCNPVTVYRESSHRFGWARVTVERVLDGLIADGYVRRVHSNTNYKSTWLRLERAGREAIRWALP